MPEELMLLMADILPTGYSVALNARRLADEDRAPWGANGGVRGNPKKGGVCVVIGCGPVRPGLLRRRLMMQVGLCAITSAKTLFDKVFATDLQPARLKLGKKHGAISLPIDELRPALLEATDGRGADAALEVVGHSGALTTAMDLVRPFGVISSCGVHSQPIMMNGDLLYSKKSVARMTDRTDVQPAVPVWPMLGTDILPHGTGDSESEHRAVLRLC
jgi:threonine dehydrogenase-like Zn-dependent dehydrogenase